MDGIAASIYVVEEDHGLYLDAAASIRFKNTVRDCTCAIGLDGATKPHIQSTICQPCLDDRLSITADLAVSAKPWSFVGEPWSALGVTSASRSVSVAPGRQLDRCDAGLCKVASTVAPGAALAAALVRGWPPERHERGSARRGTQGAEAP